MSVPDAHSSLRVTTSRSYDASLICGQPVYAETLLYHATAGGYAELGFGHWFQDKGQADFALLRRPSSIPALKISWTKSYSTVK